MQDTRCLLRIITFILQRLSNSHANHARFANSYQSMYFCELPPYHLCFYYMNRKVLILLPALFTGLFLLSGFTASAQDSTWKTLGKITFTKKYDELLGFKVDVPVFSSEVKKLDGQRITLKGYIIPVEGYRSHKEFIFSAFPYNMCFFCGGAGPETVMEVKTLKPVKYTTEPIILKGTLRLNDRDINRLMYWLEDAEISGS